jgi:hypothetical protein
MCRQKQTAGGMNRRLFADVSWYQSYMPDPEIPFQLASMALTALDGSGI